MKDMPIITAWCLPNAQIEGITKKVLSCTGSTYLRTVPTDETHSTIFFRWRTLEDLDAFVEKSLMLLFNLQRKN